MIDTRTFYVSRLNQLAEEEKKQKKRLWLFSMLRLLLFVMIMLAIFLLIPISISFGVTSIVLCIAFFLAVVKIHQQQKNRYQHISVLISINENELKALDHNYSGFDPGKEFQDTEHPYSYDMDLFGEGSVFQYLNRTVTFNGKNLLSKFLSEGTMEQNEIVNRQQSIKELAGMIDLVQDFIASGSLRNDGSSDDFALREWISKPLRILSKRSLLLVSKAFPLALMLSIVLAVFFPLFRGISVAMYLINIFIVANQSSYSTKEHRLISIHLETLKKYTVLLSNIERGTYSGKKLKHLYNTLISGPSSAAKSILSLSKIVSAFDDRLNIIAAIFLEGFLLWDIQCLIRLEKWRKNSGEFFDEWMGALAEFDALASLSTFAFNHPSYAFPEYSASKILKADQLGHFLIPSDQRVCNDFEIGKKSEFIIITGANMAGKSTFLRTVSTNLVLAMAGAPVCANSFVFRSMPIFSSMRTNDSLNKNESYFYAELKRLKEMLERLKKGDDLFIILDEILKGTNSKDKQIGSQSALKQILKYHGTGIIATHDLELARIEKNYPEKIRNLCFEIEIDKTNVSFDYKLRQGITTKMNASLLMKEMGILEE